MRKFIFAFLFVLVSAPAHATLCYVQEFSTLGLTSNGSAQIATQPAIVDQTPINFGSGHAESAAFKSGTRYIRLWCDAQVSYAFGSSPTAVNTNSPISAQQPEYFGVVAGQKISVVANP